MLLWEAKDGLFNLCTVLQERKLGLRSSYPVVRGIRLGGPTRRGTLVMIIAVSFRIHDEVCIGRRDEELKHQVGNWTLTISIRSLVLGKKTRRADILTFEWMRERATRHRAAPASNHLDPHLPEPEYYRCISPHMEEYVARTTADALWSAKYTSIRNPRWMSVATRSREALRYLSRQVGRAVTLGFRTRSIYSCGFPMNSCRNHSLDLGRRRVRAKSHDCI